MDEQKDRKAKQAPKKLGRKGKGGGMTSKENLMPIFVITKDGKELKLNW